MIEYAGIVTGTGTYPPARPLAGTIQSRVDIMIEGTGTDFASELIGKYIYANDQLRKIKSVRNDTWLYLEKPFDAPVTAGTPLTIVDGIGRDVTFINLSANTITVNDYEFAAGVEETYGGTPIWYVLGANTMQIEIQ